VNVEAFDLTILGPALVAGLLVTVTHVPLGIQVLRRGIIFIDLAVAQIAGLGVLAAAMLGWEDTGWRMQAMAFAAALSGAAALYVCERRLPEVLEAVIGVVFALAATAAVLILANNPHGGEHLRELLVGQILWVDWGRLRYLAILYGPVLVAWYLLRGAERPVVFYLLFAIAITASVQLVGVYLVFASLIVPALSVRRLGGGKLWAGYLTGVLGYVLGLAVSAALDLPAGAVIVWTLAAVGLLVSRIFAGRLRPAKTRSGMAP
jgi:zinc/manganese transport system permease protein